MVCSVELAGRGESPYGCKILVAAGFAGVNHEARIVGWSALCVGARGVNTSD
jgi:hypothetical protein